MGSGRLESLLEKDIGGVVPGVGEAARSYQSPTIVLVVGVLGVGW